jgi:flagellar biosynthetic protein FliR
VTFGLDWLPQTAFAYLLIFARVGTMLMLMPALGEQAIPARFRLSFALAVTLVFFPLLLPSLGEMPGDLLGILMLMGHEIVVGLILGGITRLITMATQVAGAVIAYQSGLSFAQSADPTQTGVQGALIGAFLSFLGITLIFATDLHHVALAAIYESYAVFSPTTEIMWDDAVRMAIDAIAGAFLVGVQMSAPFIVFGLVFNIGLGVLSRLMPQLQVFFIAMPANIAVGLILFAMLLTMMMGWYLMHFENQLATLRGV